MSLAESLRLGDRWTWVGGKGGVGKTTVAAALAVELATAGEPITLLSTDPAHSLGDALGLTLGPDPAPHPDLPHLQLLEVDAEHERRAFLDRHSAAVRMLLSRGTYLDDTDISQVTGMTVPGMDELAALLRLGRLDRETPGRMIIDTAPTGHTLRLLDLPEVAVAWVDALDAMQAKHEAIAAAFTGRSEADEAVEFLQELRDDLESIHARLQNGVETRFVVVTTREPVVLAEARRLADDLDERGIALGGIVANRTAAAGMPSAGDTGMVTVPLLPAAPVGLEGLRAFAGAAGGTVDDESDEAAVAETLALSERRLKAPPGRDLYFVAGKGGVGKSTGAAAIAISLADGGQATLLLGVDPAGSLGDLLELEVGAEPRDVAGAPHLQVQQLDAEGAWQEFREEYADQVESLFEGLLGSNLSAEHDRAVIERLLDLAPPGIDELMALMEVVDTKEDAVYDALVVDTAPTGHFLRLVQMPGLALEWCHTLLSLLLKYREVVPLGALAERILKLTRSLREIGDLLRGDRSWVLLVALPEALSVPETARLIRGLEGVEMTPAALLVNRFDAQSSAAGRYLAELLNGAAGLEVAVAPAEATGPRGVEALRSFGGQWRLIDRTSPSVKNEP